LESKKRIVIFTPDGTGIKNYLYSNVFKNTVVSLCLFHNFDEDTLSHINRNIEIDSHIVIPDYKESIKEKFLRELIHVARINFNAKVNKNPTILAFRKRNHKTIKLRLFYTIVSFSALYYRRYGSIVNLEKKYDATLRGNEFYKKVKDILIEYQPRVIFCAHQRALKAPTVFQVAKDLGIPTATVIYSWDNLAKARLALKADKYLVWSQHMKKELGAFYPEIPHEKIIVTGTPQFEFFKDPNNIIPKHEFFETYGLNPRKKLICFSGDDVKTSPYDPHYLNDLAEGLTEDGMAENYQIIFRRCPVDLSGRYDWVLRKFPDLIVEIPPLWNFSSTVWTAIYPVYGDIKLLVSLARYCDVVINVGSTMAFDFGMFQKPCIFINYNHIQDDNWSVHTIYNYQHFRSMPSKKAVYWLDSKQAIARVVKEAVEHPQTEIEEWFSVVANYVDTASMNIIKELM
jgi:hypothetical protein